VSTDADRRYLANTLALLVGFMLVEVVVGIVASSLALISDAGHMLTDAGAIALALVTIRLAARPARGSLTYGLKRAEVLSAQANGITLLLLSAWFVYEAIRRLIDPPEVEGGLVLAIALLGIGVNLLATWTISRANRESLNVEGAFQHILTDPHRRVRGQGATRSIERAQRTEIENMKAMIARKVGDSAKVDLEPANGSDAEGAATLSPVEPGDEGEGSSTTLVGKATLEGLLSEAPMHVNVHAPGSGQPPPVACANLNEAM